jgi:molybdopterin synthase sulfur carrier subunit
MKIKLKLFAMLSERLPAGSENHTMELEVPEGATPRQVVQQLGIPPELATLTLLDGVHLTQRQREERVLHEGETLAIFPPIAGGRASRPAAQR